MTSISRLKPPSVKSLQPGDSTPVSPVVIGPWPFFLLRQLEGLRSELFWVEHQARRLVGVFPRRTQGGHHFDSSIHKFFESETRATIVALHVMSRDKRIEEPSNENA